MKIHCKNCGIAISEDLQELENSSYLNHTDGDDFIPKGYYFWSDGAYFTDSNGKLIINKTDIKNTKNHTDSSRLHGCCGSHGLDGLNKTCINGHEIGTAKMDCWMAHCIIFEPNLITLIKYSTPPKAI